MSTKRLYHLLAILMVVVLTISACAPAATEAPAATDAPACQQRQTPQLRLNQLQPNPSP